MINIYITIPYLTYKHFKYGADIKMFIEKWGATNIITDSIQQLKSTDIGIDRVHDQSFVLIQYHLDKKNNSLKEIDLHNQLVNFFISADRQYCSVVVLKLLSNISYSYVLGSQFVLSIPVIGSHNDTSYNRNSN